MNSLPVLEYLPVRQGCHSVTVGPLLQLPHFYEMLSKGGAFGIFCLFHEADRNILFLPGLLSRNLPSGCSFQILVEK